MSKRKSYNAEETRAELYLIEAALTMVSDVATELARDLLKQVEPEKSEPYDADRLFRIAMLDEGWDLERAKALYEAADTLLRAKGIL